MPSPTVVALNSGVTRFTPQVLVFGLPGSGKSELIRIIEQMAAEFTGVPVVPLTPIGTNKAIQGEVIPCLVQAPNPLPGSDSIIFYDCNGKAAHELMQRREALIQQNLSTKLAETIRRSHALLCLVNAAASEREVQNTFLEMSGFIGGFQEGRLISREVGGLPVFLVLTRCDELREHNQDYGEWDAVVEQRMDWVRKIFREQVEWASPDSDTEADSATGSGDEFEVEGATPQGFGTLDLRVRAVARQLTSFTDTTAQPEPWRVRELFVEVADAARGFCLRDHQAKKRFRATVAGAGGFLSLLLIFLMVFGITGGFGPRDFLADRVRAFQANEGPPEIRFADRHLAKNIRELETIHAAPTFPNLPDPLHEFVTRRLKEYETYREYRLLFRAPRLGPAEVRTHEQLETLRRELQSTLAPPEAYAASWSRTDAVKLWKKWQKDLELFHEAETHLQDWFRTLIRRGNQLLLTTNVPDYGWRTQVVDLLRVADQPPFPPDAAVGPSQALPMLRGKKLEYDSIYAYERVSHAHRDWLDTREHLIHLRDLTDALGMTNGPESGPAVLDLPEPSAAFGDSRDLALSRLAALHANYSAPVYTDRDYPAWKLDRYPDAVRKVLETRLKQSMAGGTRHVRRLLLTGLGDAANPEFETRESWQRLADTTLQQEPLKAWGRLLGLMQYWLDSMQTVPNPVAELADFLRKDQFALTVRTVTVSIPNDLLSQKLIPTGKFVLTHTPHNGTPVEVNFKPEGNPQSERLEMLYSFTIEGRAADFTFRPGDTLAATLAAKSAGQDYQLIWSAGSSSVYQLDRLTRTPRLVRQGLLAVPEPAAGVKLETMPPNGVPMLPALFPDLRAGTR